MWLSAAFALLVVGLVAWVVTGALGTSQTTGLPDDFADAPPPPAFEDGARDVERIEDLLAAAEEGRIELVDDQNRVTRELIYERLDPQPGGRVNVVSPEAWLHLDRGRVAHLTARRGSMSRPPGRREPESGRFEGDVVIHLYEQDPRDDGASPTEWPEAEVSLFTDSLQFDTTLGELRTSAPVHIDSRGGVTADFTGMTLMFDQPNRRLAYLRSDNGGVIRAAPTARPDEEDEAEPSGARAEQRADEAPADETPARIDLYHAEFLGGVRLASGARQVDAEQLDLWARLIDGDLSPETLAGFGALSATETQGDAGSEQTAEAEPADAASPSGADQDIVLAWDGPIVVRPIDETPIGLADADALVRFTAPARGAVIAQDQESGATARCVSLEYAPDERTITLTGAGPTGVTVSAPDAAEAVTGRFELNLATGLASMPGPGVLRGLGRTSGVDPYDPTGDVGRMVTWQERCDLTLATRGGALDLAAPAPLRRADFAGRVEGRDGDLRVNGDRLSAFFAGDASGSPALQRVVVAGSAGAVAGDSGRVSADRLDVEFIETDDAAALTPSVGTAQGDVFIEREGATLRSDLAEAHFERDGAGDLVVRTFNADLGVEVETPQGVEALADSLRADPERGVVDLVGEPVVLRQRGASISGDSMRLSESPRHLTVFGAGALTRRQPREGGLGYEHFEVEWSGSMEFDDQEGRAEFHGDCVATADVSDLARDVVQAERILLDLRPGAAAALEGEDEAEAERALRRAEAHGGPDAPARVESRRYRPDVDSETGLTLERLIFLEGPLIIAEAEERLVRVPAPGRLLLEDRRARDDRDRDADDLRMDLSGTTLFEWDGEFELSRFTGEGVMRERVRMRRRSPGAERITELECERLNTLFAIADSAPVSTAEPGPDLLWAEATGAVYAAHGGRQMIADRLFYDAALGVAEATAAEGNEVTLFDRERGVPLTGTLLRWDLSIDRIDWRGAGATAAPD